MTFEWFYPITHRLPVLILFCLFASAQASPQRRKPVHKAQAAPATSSAITRPLAAKILAEEFEKVPTISQKINIRFSQPASRDGLAKQNDELGILYRLGYIDCEMVTDDRNPYTNEPQDPYCRVVLTPKGVKASSGWIVETYGKSHIESLAIPVGKWQLVAVTGISMVEGFGPVAQVQYTRKVTAFGEIGEQIAKLPSVSLTASAGTAFVRKFDDGWRIDGVFFIRGPFGTL